MSLELWLAEILVQDTAVAAVRFLCVDGYRGYVHGRFIGTDTDLRREVNRRLAELRDITRDMEQAHDAAENPMRRAELQALRRKIDDLTQTVKTSPHGSSRDTRVKRIPRSSRKNLKEADHQILKGMEEARNVLTENGVLQYQKDANSMAKCTGLLQSAAEGFNMRAALIGPLRWRGG